MTLAAIEGGFRLFVEVTDVPFYFWDPAVGPRKLPGQSGIYRVGDNIRGRYHFNSQGWNHAEDYSPRKPRGLSRVAVVGDSHVEALQVDVDQTLFAVAEARMRAAGTPNQWYAFGISGYGVSQEYEVIRRYVLDYAPDLVILLFVQNDPYDTSPYLFNPEPFFVRYLLDDEDQLLLVPPSPWRPSPFRRLAARSAAVRYFMLQKRLLDRLRQKPVVDGIGAQPLREGMARAGASIVPGLDSLSFEERQRRTWLLIEKLFAAARDECRHRGAQFAVAFRGWDFEILDPIEPEKVPTVPRDRDPYCLAERAREMGREWVGPIAGHLGIPYIDLTSTLRAEVARTGRSHSFPDDGHYSELGHRAAGEALARWASDLLSKQNADRP